LSEARDPVGGEPLPFLEGDDGEASFLAGDSIDRAQCEEAEVCEPLLKRAGVGVRLPAGVRRGFGGGTIGRVACARVTGRERA
jgi:hypothetical protein